MLVVIRDSTISFIGYLVAHAENTKEFVVLLRIEFFHRNGKSSDDCCKSSDWMKPNEE